ncbi:P-loop containing nucleoside triphosphate hydrolase protein [Coniochaeta ligniaria NRRL 30616]|uniref:p-loop containing nucleoside triphosphate hydrolase protein n=1 Tax=Coniochaeta ligniaria NRRL 30616 TaxID=1408157 RepID=A0A1J7JR57_9PEZI|nr:P-loop containing nucleoside triphosphate hydrolase protein [Coniochaeta ligniaria NRRL 30616]
MVLAKSTKSVGLGNSLMNDRFGKGKGGDRKKGAGVKRINHATGEEYITNEREEASWVKMRSVTQQGALDEFLSTAELAGTDFTAEKSNNTKIIHIDQKNPYLLSPADERKVRNKQKEHRARLTVPRRPKWDASTTREELDALEKESFMDWRRGLAELQESNDLLMTPFERNLEVWRQLWRVIERSDVIVQIVDARNPLMFRSDDLESYVKDVDPTKQNLLLINKADMMTYNQRKAWASYLKGANIPYKFFSASLAKEEIEARDAEDEAAEANGGVGSSTKPAPSQKPESEEDSDESESEDEDSADDEEEDTKILSVDELERIFLTYSPKDPSRKLQVGLVGYPNVGKSSTINALLGAKKVSVSSTPGKTKHFQTLHLSDKVILCDCPGLVFPNFATTKADLVCNGVLPIDQLREFTGPVTLVTQRIPQPFLEATYGIQIRTRPLEEGGTGVPTGPELLTAYARHRGFMTTGQGQPDQSRAARYVLKDYVNGKLLYCEPPPGGEDPTEFNRELYDLAHLPEKRRQAVLEALSLEDDDDVSLATEVVALPAGPKTVALDKGFFKAAGSGTGHLARPFNYKYSEQGKAASEEGKHLSGRKLRTMIAMEKGIDPKDVQLMSGKKHFKGGPTGRVKGKKQRNQVTGDNPE